MSKSVDFTRDGINLLPEDKPVVYRIQDSHGKDLYVGVAKAGKVRERILEHLPAAKLRSTGGSDAT